MTLFKATRESKCSKCNTPIKVGEELCAEKGKPPLCKKCAPPDVKKQTWIPKPAVKTLFDEYALAFIARGLEGKKVMELADFMVAESKKRRDK